MQAAHDYEFDACAVFLGDREVNNRQWRANKVRKCGLRCTEIKQIESSKFCYWRVELMLVACGWCCRWSYRIVAVGEALAVGLALLMASCVSCGLCVRVGSSLCTYATLCYGICIMTHHHVRTLSFLDGVEWHNQMDTRKILCQNRFSFSEVEFGLSFWIFFFEFC